MYEFIIIIIVRMYKNVLIYLDQMLTSFILFKFLHIWLNM